MSHFIAHSVTPGMGLRESINAMLSQVAYNGRPFGYLPDAVHQSNFEALLDSYGECVTESNDTLILVPQITDSMFLAVLTDELVKLCNLYPIFDEELYHQIERSRELEAVTECLTDEGIDDVTPEDVHRELFEASAELEHSEYGVHIYDADFNRAVESARTANNNK